MANKKHLAILRQGVEVWNRWREVNPSVRPDLAGADLSRANLKGANLSRADLSEADLDEVNLSEADLSEAYLAQANLVQADLIQANLWKTVLFWTTIIDTRFVRADLREANLCLAVIVNTDFTNALLTGACIDKWNIGSDTDFDNVTCDYIYLKCDNPESSDNDNDNYFDRRPHDPNAKFAPGEFSKLFQVSLETVDLIFSNGIEWAVFLETFEQLRREVNSDDLALQGIEQKPGGAFVVRLTVPDSADKGKIEQYVKHEYEVKLKVL